MLGPINLELKLKLNPKPESDGSKFTTPKITVSLVMEKLNVSVSRNQYLDLIALLDSIDNMLLASRVRKFQPPQKQIIGNETEW